MRLKVKTSKIGEKLSKLKNSRKCFQKKKRQGRENRNHELTDLIRFIDISLATNDTV